MMVEISIDGLMVIVVVSGVFSYWLGYLVGHSCGVSDERNATGGAV